MSNKPSKQVKDAAKILKNEQKQLVSFKKESQNLKDKAKEKIGGAVKAVKTLATDEQKLIRKTANDTLELGKENRASIGKELTKTQTLAKEAKESIDDKLSKINTLFAEITEYHGKLLTEKNGKSIKKEVAEYVETQQEDFKKLREVLTKEIRDLLPEAGASGLSSAYFEAKKIYGAVPYKKLTEEEEDAKTNWHFIKIIGHFIGTNTKGVMFYTLFIAPLVAIIILMLYGTEWG